MYKSLTSLVTDAVVNPIKFISGVIIDGPFGRVNFPRPQVSIVKNKIYIYEKIDRSPERHEKQ